MVVTPGMPEHGACGPTQMGMNRQPSAATSVTQAASKFPYAQAQLSPPR